jgi:hypothetical protein
MNGFSIRHVYVGLIFALAALLAGQMHGMAFGAKEDAIIESFRATAEAAAATHGSPEAVNKAVDGGWKYLKRAHEHFMGLGAMAVALCLLIGHATVKPLYKKFAATAVGFGAFTYPFFWFLVANKTPAVGAHTAKESLSLIAQAGAGAGFLGLIGTFVIVIMWVRSTPCEKNAS